MATPAVRDAKVSPFHGVAMPAAGYLLLPEEKPYLEYIDGRVVQKPVVNREHARIVARLDALFVDYARALGGGDYGPERRVFIPRRGNYYLPDAAFWRPGVPADDDTVPTLAVEVASPGQSREELRRKCRDYREAGAEVAWLIDPEERAIEVFEAGRDGAVVRDGWLESPALPGLRVELASLFD